MSDALGLGLLCTRTLALATLADDAPVTPLVARQILGIGATSLLDRAREGSVEVAAVTSSGHRRYNVSNLLDLLMDQGQDLTLFDLVRRADGPRLSRPTYLAETRRLRENPGWHGQWWRVYRKDGYDMPGDMAWEAWRAGDRERALRLLDEEIPELEGQRGYLRSCGVADRRLWVPDLPLDSHGKFLAESHRRRAAAGLPVDVRPAHTLPYLEYQDRIPEVTVFYDYAVYRLCYTPDGVPDGAVRLAIPGLAIRYARILEEIALMGSPIREFAPATSEGEAA